VIVLAGRDYTMPWTAPIRPCATRLSRQALALRCSTESHGFDMTVVLGNDQSDEAFRQHCPANNISLQVERGGRHALNGPNGAGKTTLINLLSGVTEPTDGRILLDGQDISSLPTHQGVRLGMPAPSRLISDSKT
jgi:ABC-type polysaccharide/polyol phosphate transport system ATPase subunit